MKKQVVRLLSFILLLTSCSSLSRKPGERVITVSIPPFEYFVKAVADSDFTVNVMLPPGADHHSWEPLPGQIMALAKSEAFIINGCLGFEYAWMGRFRDVNPEMKIKDLSESISLIEPERVFAHTGHENEGADPHYWISPKEAYAIAEEVRDLVKELNPGSAEKYESNYSKLIQKIAEVDSAVTRMFGNASSKTFMIFHPALTYIARDYGLEQISFEDEGKDPSPARMKDLIDMTRSKGIKIIFIQAEYDLKSAKVLADETGARLVRINPMNPEWDTAVIEIGKAISRGGD